MRCFYHSQTDAVGTCKACSKGVCEACAVDTGGGLACRQGCVEAVRALDDLIQRNLRVTAVSQRAPYVFPLFLVFMGIGFSVAPFLAGSRPNPFGVFLGLLFVALGGYFFWVARKVRGGT